MKKPRILADFRDFFGLEFYPTGEASGATPLADAVQIANREDDRVVDKVHQDSRLQTKCEHQVEEVQSDEPGVDQTEQTLILVTVAEFDVGDNHSRADEPG